MAATRLPMRRLREQLRLKYDAGLMADTAHATAPVTDHRPAPRGVLPRGMEMWLLLGVAFGILVIVLCAGRPEPADRLGATAAPGRSP